MLRPQLQALTELDPEGSPAKRLDYDFTKPNVPSAVVDPAPVQTRSSGDPGGGGGGAANEAAEAERGGTGGAKGGNRYDATKGRENIL
eukprot:624709-Prorocentrum_minimum.AAC.2